MLHRLIDVWPERIHEGDEAQDRNNESPALANGAGVFGAASDLRGAGSMQLQLYRLEEWRRAGTRTAVIHSMSELAG
jgi:hypothetical protein